MGYQRVRVANGRGSKAPGPTDVTEGGHSIRVQFV